MEDREWMYTGRRGRNDVTTEWIRKTDDSVERAYGEAAKGASLVACSCSKYANRFRTTNYDKSQPSRKTTCSGVFTPSLDNVDYFGRIEEIYELNFYGSKPLTTV